MNPRVAGTIVQGLAVITGGGALSIGAAWVGGRGSFATLGASDIPMAPSTAWLFVLLNAALFLQAGGRGRRYTRAAGWLASLVVAAVAALSLANALWPTGGGLEAALAPASEAIAGIPTGRMSHFTAVTLLLAALSLLLQLPATGRARLARHAGGLFAVLVLLAGLAVALSYLAGAPLLYGGSAIPMAFATAVAFVLDGIGLLTASAAGAWVLYLFPTETYGEGQARLRRSEWILLGALLSLTAVIGTGGLLYLRQTLRDGREKAQNELLAVADLKVRQIVHWREERLKDANFFARAPFVARDVEALAKESPSRGAGDEVLRWMALLKGGKRYSRVTLWDSGGALRLSVPDDEGTTPRLRARTALTLQSGTVSLSDLEEGETPGDTRMYVAVPIFGESDPARRQGLPRPASGAIILELDPHEFLFPLVQSWPIPSRTAESMLVRREGSGTVVLNELRHPPASGPGPRRLPTGPGQEITVDVPGKAVVREGLDYRGVPVLAAGLAVPGTSWTLVSKMDQVEIYAPIRQRVQSIIVLLPLVSLLVIMGLGWLWRERHEELLEQQLVAERERTALAERVAHLMKCANDAILMTDDAWRIVDANDRAVESYGWPMPELLARGMSDLRAPEARESFGRVAETIRAQNSALFETVHQRSDGSTFPVEVSVSLVEIGGVHYKLALIRDTTERKRSETSLRQALLEAADSRAALLELNTELEKRVAERTTQLEAINRELEAFTYSVSHDLRAPLRAVNGYARILLEDHAGKLDAEAQRVLGVVCDEATRMGRVIDDLLRFSRLGRQALRVAPTDMTALVGEVFHKLRQLTSERDVDFRLTPLPSVPADHALMREVWLNLLDNALKYTRPRERAVIEVDGTVEGGSVVYRVRDNGVGFDMKYAGKLFGAFQRLHKAEEFEGTGVGLALVQRLVSRHGGRVWAEATTGRGATFHFSLPTREAEWTGAPVREGECA